MKETTVLNQISKLVENINYKSVYIEIQTDKNRYTLEKDSNKTIGFQSNNKWNGVNKNEMKMDISNRRRIHKKSGKRESSNAEWNI